MDNLSCHDFAYIAGMLMITLCPNWTLRSGRYFTQWGSSEDKLGAFFGTDPVYQKPIIFNPEELGVMLTKVTYISVESTVCCGI